MKPYYADDWLTVYHGDCREAMAAMEPESVHCVVTSPPYWGLRDYGEAGQLGLERTPEEYVANMVAVFREVRRVLRADGTVWLNLGDSYASGEIGRHDAVQPTANGPTYHSLGVSQGKRQQATLRSGLKPKDLVGIPWRVAFALQADGWYLRSDIIWSKPNPMPESVTDRPTKSHEYLFLLSKSPRYYFDADAVAEPVQSGPSDVRKMMEGKDRLGGLTREQTHPMHAASGLTNIGRKRSVGDPSGRNIRSVWTIATAPYPGAHFATFPPKLVEPCIKAGTSEKGVCPECGAPWQREVERTPADRTRQTGLGVDSKAGTAGRAGTPIVDLIGWRPSCRHICDCDPRHDDPHHHDPVPATVLDPFAGSGTTGMVAQSLSRRAVLIDLSLDYLDQLMARNADIPLGLGA